MVSCEMVAEEIAAEEPAVVEEGAEGVGEAAKFFFFFFFYKDTLDISRSVEPSECQF